MKFNKILLILSIFIVLLSVGSVSANDNITDLNQEDGIIDEVNYQTNDIVQASVLSDNTTINTQIVIENSTIYYKNGTPLVVVLLDENNAPIANQTITITINGVSYLRTTDENGTASMSINLSPGVYVYTVQYNGSDIYNSSIANATFTVLSTISSSDLIKYYRNGTQYHATYFDKNNNPIVGAEVSFNINGVFYIRITDENGTATLNINLSPGTYILTTINPNDGLYRSYNITVLSTIESNNITKYYRNGTQYYATFLDSEGNLLINATVTFNINGVLYNRVTDENGTAMLNINLSPGKYILTATNPNDTLQRSYMIEVLSTLVVKDQSFKYNRTGTSGRYSVQVVDGQGNPIANVTVTLNINGVFYNRTTDENGTAYLNINLNPGKYIISATLDGLTVSSIVNVNKMEATITVLTSSIKSGEYYQVKFTIKGSNDPVAGRAIYFIFGEDDSTAYRVTTNAEGIASIRIYALPGSYMMISAIQADAFFDNIASYNTVRIS